jgi:hypothetical protein
LGSSGRELKERGLGSRVQGFRLKVSFGVSYLLIAEVRLHHRGGGGMRFLPARDAKGKMRSRSLTG